MRKLLQINPVLRMNTSTGRIMQEIGELAMQNGWESHIAYSRGRDGIKPCKSHLLPVGDRWSVAWHGIMTRLLDRHGLSSDHATRQFVQQIKDLQPDIIHIHNLHGYFLNYRILFDYLSRCGIPVVWTVHDCWLYTGHCYYYSFTGCDRWKTGCSHCPQQHKFPASWWKDRSRQNFMDKKAAFTSIPKERLVIVPVSEWIKDEIQQSFLGDYDMRVIHNGIDLDNFDLHDAEQIKAKHHLSGKYILLGVASIWSKEKGLDDFLRLSSILDDDELIILVGVNNEQKKRLPDNIIGIARTRDVRQLAELYSAADVFINPTWQDNYPTVNLEAIACGTPVVTYHTGGSVEAITENTGIVVEQGDVPGLLEAVRKIERRGKAFYRQACRDYALANFRKEDRYYDYIKLYDELTQTPCASFS